MPYDAAPAQRSQPDVSVVICTLDEDQAIGGVLAELDQALAGHAREIIVVDDSADERTADVVRAYAAGHEGVRLLRRQGGRGLASAAIAGWDCARGRTLALMDGDGQHDPALIAAMLRQQAEGQDDVVIASRYLASEASGLGPVRHAMSRAGTIATRVLIGQRLADPMSGCFLMTRQWYAQVRPALDGALGFKILIDVLADGPARPRVAQLPTRLRERAGGQSKLDMRVMLELAAQLVEKGCRGVVSARMAMFFGVGLTGLGVHLSVLSLATWAGRPFWLAQMLAIWLAMSWNFWLNNILTFRDSRLHGLRALRGLVVFYVSCLSAAIVSEALGVVLDWLGAPWWLAGVGGAVLAGVMNYHLSRRAAWGQGVPAAEQQARVLEVTLPAAPVPAHRD